MIRPASYDFRRIGWAAGWLVLGIVCGMFLARGQVAGFVGKVEAKSSRGKISTITRTNEDPPPRHRRPRAVKDALLSVTPQQLGQIAVGGGRLPEFSSLIGLQNMFGTAGHVPTATEQDGKLETMLASTRGMLGFNAEEAKQLQAILTQTTQELREIERTSLPIREIQPGTLELDFDSIADLEAPVFEKMRSQLRAQLGQSALRDLDVLGGLAELTGTSGESKNCELIFSRKDVGWETWSIVPGPGGRQAHSVGMPQTHDYRQAVEDLIRLGEEGRFTHLQNRIPSDLTPP